MSALLFAAYLAIAAVVATAPLPPGTLQQLQAIGPLLVTLGLITVAVSIALNPWRIDRVSDRFPHILQDTLIVLLFAVAATVFMREKVLTTTAVGAVVIGFALQDTLGNLFAGLAIQVEKPFRVGDWVSIGSRDGIVTAITWRATKMRTTSNDFVIVPNSVLSKDTITNYSQPTAETRIDIEIGASYDTPPNEVKAAILDAIRDEPLLAGSRPPDVLISDFAAYAVTVDPGHQEVARVHPGGFFGEMSLLTGEPRTATVSAVTDCDAVEITTEAFRQFVLAQGAVLECITAAGAARRDELRRHAETIGPGGAPADESTRSLLDRVRRFLRLAQLS